jgi:hypothetical protein
VTEMLYAGPVDDLDALIAACQFPPEAFVLVERLPQQVVVTTEERQKLLRFARLREGVKVATYTSGRIFYKDFELRWEKQDGKIQAVYLGAERSIPSLEFVCSLPEPKTRHYYLFGELLTPKQLERIGIAPAAPDSGNYYAEVRIPRLLRYPAPEGARRVRLAVCEYSNETTGNLEWFRFQGLEEAAE